MSKLQSDSGSNANVLLREEVVATTFERILEDSLKQVFDDAVEEDGESVGSVHNLALPIHTASGKQSTDDSNIHRDPPQQPLPPSLPFWERLSKDRKEDYAEFAKLKNDLEMEECTFEPKTNENSGKGVTAWEKAKVMTMKKKSSSKDKKKKSVWRRTLCCNADGPTKGSSKLYPNFHVFFSTELREIPS